VEVRNRLSEAASSVRRVITTLAVHGYRSLRDLVVPLGGLTVITGANGSGKSSLYQAFRLLSDTSSGGVVSALAEAGGLSSVLWAGPETISRAMRSGEVPVQGKGSRRHPVSLMLGFATDRFSYLVDVGLPTPRQSLFARDPELKREVVWDGPVLRPAATLLTRLRSTVKVRAERGWETVIEDLGPRESVLTSLSNPSGYPELSYVRSAVSSWRFHDHIRTDRHAPARQPQIGTWSPILDHDGRNLAAAVETVRESAWAAVLEGAIADAFDSSTLVVVESEGLFFLSLRQPGMLRPMGVSELSDGTLRYVAMATALLSPRPPSLLVLNEPETSLHPQLTAPLARLITAAARRTQIVVVTHSAALVEAIGREAPDAVQHELVKELGETRVADQGLLTRPRWDWGSR
jgi:predicted ATPase